MSLVMDEETAKTSTGFLAHVGIEKFFFNCFNGGSNHWLYLMSDELYKDKTPIHTWATRTLFEGKSFIISHQQDVEVKGVVTLEKLLEVISKTWDKLNISDAKDCDIIIQTTAFGKKIF